MATVVFVDGSVVSAATWHELELALRQDAWNPSKKAPFREEMARRAWNWSRTLIREDVELASRKFIVSLEKAGLLRVVS
jgi:hypothetical protein